MIARVSTSFVPAAVNLYKVRRDPGPAGELFRSVQRQHDQYQGIWVVAPDGKVLAAHHTVRDPKTWTREVLDTLDRGLQDFGPVEPRHAPPSDPLPHRGRGLLADGGVTLAVSTRYLHGTRPDGPAVVDTLPLTADEWRSFSPPHAMAGATWIVPEAVARKLSRLLSPSSDQSTMPRPEEVTDVRLTATVTERTDRTAHLTFTGRIAARHTYEKKPAHAEGRLTGTATYDVRTGHLTALELRLAGTYRSFPPYDAPREIGAVAEWTSDERRP